MITNLMKPIYDICKQENIEIFQTHMGKDSPLDKKLPFATVTASGKCIFLDSESDIWSKRVSLAHEFAHHIFGHLDIRQWENGVIPKAYEVEAQIFSVVYVAIALFFDSFFENYMDEMENRKEKKTDESE